MMDEREGTDEATDEGTERVLPEATDEPEAAPMVKIAPTWPLEADLREDHGFLVSVDVGQQHDYSAVAVLQRWVTTSYTRNGAPIRLEDIEQERAEVQAVVDARRRCQNLSPRPALDHELGVERHRVTSYEVLACDRQPLGTPFPQVVAHVCDVLRHPRLQGRPPVGRIPGRSAPVLVLDATSGIGGMTDAFYAAGIPRYRDASSHRHFWPITIHGGDAVTRAYPFVRVPKRDLCRLVGILLETPIGPPALGRRRLGFARGMPGLDILVSELKAFQVKINLATGHDAYEAWREQDHDDEVLSVALGCWVGEQLGREPPGEYRVVGPGA